MTEKDGLVKKEEMDKYRQKLFRQDAQKRINRTKRSHI